VRQHVLQAGLPNPLLHRTRLACSEPGVDFGSVLSFRNVLLIRTAGGAGELKIR